MALRDLLMRLGLVRPQTRVRRGVRQTRLSGTPPGGVPRPAPVVPQPGDARATVALGQPGAPPPPPPQAAPLPAPAPAAPPPAPAQAPPPAVPSPSPSDAEATRYGVEAVGPRRSLVGVLVAVEGELEGEVYKVRDGENKLGRAEGCDIVLASEWISREHARLVHRDGVFAVAALSDRNPVHVNDEATEGTELRDRDLLKLGRTTFRFRSVA